MPSFAYTEHVGNSIPYHFLRGTARRVPHKPYAQRNEATMNPFVGSWYRFAADGSIVDRDAVPQRGSMAPQNVNRIPASGDPQAMRDRVYAYYSTTTYSRQRLPVFGR